RRFWRVGWLFPRNLGQVIGTGRLSFTCSLFFLFFFGNLHQPSPSQGACRGRGRARGGVKGACGRQLGVFEFLCRGYREVGVIRRESLAYSVEMNGYTSYK
ncbi:hypothetical protein CSPAE12_00282, partial [Colletotrichum incanum]